MLGLIFPFISTGYVRKRLVHGNRVIVHLEDWTACTRDARGAVEVLHTTTFIQQLN